MKLFISLLCTVLLIVGSLNATEINLIWNPSAEGDTVNSWPYPAFYVQPGEMFYLNYYAQSDSSQFTSDYTFFFPYEENPYVCYIPDSPMNGYSQCGHLQDSLFINNLSWFWNDATQNCNQHWGMCSHYQLWNVNFSVGQVRQLGADILSYLRVDSTNWQFGYDWQFFRLITDNDIRGDWDGDGDLDWDDVSATELMWVTNDFGPYFKNDGPNPARTLSFSSSSVSMDPFFMSLALTDPTHPMIADFHYGEAMSVMFEGGSPILQHPAEIDATGRVTASGAQVIAITGQLLTEDESFETWRADAWSPNGYADFQLPSNLIMETVHIEAVSWLTAMDLEEMSNLATEYSLGTNYPNPFNPTTQIPFELPRYSPVELSIYNMLGQKVATVLDGQVMEPGMHTVSFDGSSLASGVYIYAISAGNFFKANKMVLMK